LSIPIAPLTGVSLVLVAAATTVTVVPATVTLGVIVNPACTTCTGAAWATGTTARPNAAAAGPTPARRRCAHMFALSPPWEW
jgi:hypothetical protein